MNFNAQPVIAALGIAVLASLLAEARWGTLRVPAVVWEMLLGILIGPHVLRLVQNSSQLEWLGGSLGLAALFFMAGMELNLNAVKGHPLSLALWGWLLSLGIGLVAAIFLHRLPSVHAPMSIALALATTAMGTFMPMLRDAGRLDSKFGAFVLAAGAVGEFAPIIGVSLVLTHENAPEKQAALLVGFVVVAVGVALVALSLRPPRILNLLERGLHSSTQLPICISLLLLISLDQVSRNIGFEAVLGAFTAGVIVGLASRGERGKLFREKMEAICFGFFIPFFFVVSGIDLDVGALFLDPRSLLLLPVFLALFLLVRGTPVLLYRNHLAEDESLPFVLYSATTLPMLVVIAHLGVRTGQMPHGMAAALEGAGILSVLLFPTTATALMSRSARKGLRASV
ncbi:MAG: cation:proton antiporter [Acidobacteriaceae bacterium]